MIAALGEPEAVYVRDDVGGGMVTVAYGGERILLTQWSVPDVEANVAVVTGRAAAEEVTAGRLHALWTAGAARGTFTVVGADGADHRETFGVSDGALLWQENGVGFLLRGAETKENAAELAASVG